MDLSIIWFVLIAVLWIGYFVLEGFDFGVGMLVPVLGRDADPAIAERKRRVVLNTIGPHWDGNEVWLLTAGGATFAAFPHWYATLFSGFYLPLLLILVALILRGMAIEYRHKEDSDSWRARWDVAGVVGSFLPALLWGVAFTNIVVGVPIDENMEYTGTLLTLLNPLALLGGLATLTVFLTHGALFVALKTTGELREDARRLAVKIGLVAAVLTVAWMVLVMLETGNTVAWVLTVVGALSLAGGLLLAARGNEKAGFWGSFLAIALVVAALFVALFPDVMPSSTNAAWSLTHENASATDYTLGIMTWVAVLLTPVVIAYQAYTYWVFRKRLSTHNIPDAKPYGTQATRHLARDARG
ncbi:cytochrome bd-I ubiquinol oxidase subunit 2 apoprotein [Kytococcus aerolatus]|uniref:Cytochrome bd-I ubiquinol oxidase subunit 2 apoprotein n=1 Tax=Kytococcus aerolatus TaxID=592308 RepID=A0A212TFB9_9MICO|nr:cytochrome d ubiquinol oxidase subunit II [Kytococcus aerolatus]SNC64531.1 cytochrome bd-I ubiquinol oxidase subunit 2 apoprotein [Kytococcus aerolatus]